MRRPRRNQSSEFEAKVALAAILGKPDELEVGEEGSLMCMPIKSPSGKSNC